MLLRSQVRERFLHQDGKVQTVNGSGDVQRVPQGADTQSGSLALHMTAGGSIRRPPCAPGGRVPPSSRPRAPSPARSSLTLTHFFLQRGFCPEASRWDVAPTHCSGAQPGLGTHHSREAPTGGSAQSTPGGCRKMLVPGSRRVLGDFTAVCLVAAPSTCSSEVTLMQTCQLPWRIPRGAGCTPTHSRTCRFWSGMSCFFPTDALPGCCPGWGWLSGGLPRGGVSQGDTRFRIHLHGGPWDPQRLKTHSLSVRPLQGTLLKRTQAFL